MKTSFTPTFAHVPPGPLAGPLQLLPVNAAVVSVHTRVRHQTLQVVDLLEAAA